MLKEKASNTNNTEDNTVFEFDDENNENNDNATNNDNNESNDKDNPQNENQNLLTPQPNPKKRSPGPFAGKKQKLSKYVKKYEYPKWVPPEITIEQYFKLAKPTKNKGESSLPKITENKEPDKETEETEPNFLTNPVMSSPATTPHGSSLLSRMFRKKQKTKNKRKNKNTHEKNNSNVSDNVNNDDVDENEENENSEVSSDRESEHSTSQTDNDHVAEEFNDKSIYQTSTFQINSAPVNKTMKTFKLMLAISEKFGLTVEEMVTVLDAAAPTSRLARKLKEFLEIKMPPGFPVQLELPLYHVLKATVTFQNFKEMEISADVFTIPEDYVLVDKDDVGGFEEENQ